MLGMRKLTILSVAFPFAVVTADPVGGAEQVLAQIDRSLVEAGHRSIMLASEDSQPAGHLIKIPKISGPIGREQWTRAHEFIRATISRAVERERVDLVHLHGVDFLSYLPQANVRVLATLHLPLSYYPRELHRADRSRTWLNTVSASQHRSVSSHPHLAALIENGVPIPDQSASYKEAFALAMGRICPEKGFHVALDAAKAANMPLKLAGSFDAFPEHMDYFDREIMPRLDSERQWIGPISGRLKWQLLASARCVLVPSLVPETASLVAREALAAGTPVIAFPNGALCETVESGRTGFLVHNVEEMSRALSRTREIDPSACRRAAEQKYSAARMTRQYLELYERLMEYG
jgi:glycosyltransferase involved in cell wall biosynthesis